MSDTPALASIPGLDAASLARATIRLNLVYANPDSPPPYDHTSSAGVQPSSHAGDPRRGGARRRSRISTTAGGTQPEEPRRTRSARFSGDASTQGPVGSRSFPQHTNDDGPYTTHAVIDPESGSTDASVAYTWSGCASFIRDKATFTLSPILPNRGSITDGMAFAGKILSCAVVVGLATSLASDLAEGGDGSKWWRQVSDVGANVMSGFGFGLDNDDESKGVSDGKTADLGEEHGKWW